MKRLLEIKNWKEMVNEVVQGDCLEGMKLIPDKNINLVLTDPPYAIGKNYGNTSDLNFSKEWFLEAKRIANGICFTPGIKNMFEFEKPDWVLCWFKPGALLRSKYGFNSWEPMLIYSLPASTKEPDVIRCSIGKQKEVGDHPTPKPLELFQKIILRFTQPGDLICDPFMGSWTTARACKDLGRNFIGFELEEKYCRIGEERLRQEILF